MKKDTRERFTLRLPSELMKKLQEEANDLGISLNALILQVLWEWADKNNSGMKKERSER